MNIEWLHQTVLGENKCGRTFAALNYLVQCCDVWEPHPKRTCVFVAYNRRFAAECLRAARTIAHQHYGLDFSQKGPRHLVINGHSILFRTLSELPKESCVGAYAVDLGRFTNSGIVKALHGLTVLGKSPHQTWGTNVHTNATTQG